MDENKKEFLLSLIAEKILVLQAREEGLESDSILLSSLHEVEKNLVRDELYRREISGKVTIPENEIESAVRKSSVDYKVYFLFLKTQREADSVYREIVRGQPLESFSSKIFRIPNGDMDSAIARWGDIDERMEKVVYSMKLNQTSQPFELDDGWYIVKIMGKVVSFIEGETEKKTQREKVISILRQRKEIKRMNQYMSDELKTTKTEINSDLFKSVVLHLWEAAKEERASRDSFVFSIDNSVRAKLFSLMKNSLGSPWIIYPQGTWSLEKTIDKIISSNLAVPDPTYQSIYFSIEQRLKDLIDQEYLTRRGYAMKLNLTAAVQNDMKTWHDEYLAQRMRKIIGDTIVVNETEVKDFQRLFQSDSMISHNDSIAAEKCTALKRENSIDKVVGSRAAHTTIRIYSDNLNNTEVTRAPSLVYRLLGFGGRMFAAPFVQPQIGWIRYWNRNDSVLP
jgi:hypothetical protein